MTCPRDSERLQEDVYSMCEWLDRWLLKFHPEKCKTMSIRNRNETKRSNTRIPAFTLHGN